MVGAFGEGGKERLPFRGRVMTGSSLYHPVNAFYDLVAPLPSPPPSHNPSLHPLPTPRMTRSFLFLQRWTRQTRSGIGDAKGKDANFLVVKVRWTLMLYVKFQYIRYSTVHTQYLLNGIWIGTAIHFSLCSLSFPVQSTCRDRLPSPPWRQRRHTRRRPRRPRRPPVPPSPQPLPARWRPTRARLSPGATCCGGSWTRGSLPQPWGCRRTRPPPRGRLDRRQPGCNLDCWGRPRELQDRCLS